MPWRGCPAWQGRCPDRPALCHAHVDEPRPHGRAGHHPRRPDRRHPRAEHRGLGRATGHAARAGWPGLSIHHQDQGATGLSRGIREHRPAHRGCRQHRAAARRGASRAWRQLLQCLGALRRTAGDGAGGLPGARRQRAGRGRGRDRRTGAAEPRLSRRCRLRDPLRHHRIRGAIAQRCHQHPHYDLRAGHRGGVPVPGQPARDPDPRGGDPGVADRNLCLPAGLRHVAEHDLAVRACPGHRHRRGRCHRRSREWSSA